MTVIGYTDEVNLYFVSGWIADTARLDQSLGASVFVDDINVGQLQANVYRQGLETIAPGATGLYAFKYYFKEVLSPFETYKIEVRASQDGVTIEPGSLTLKPVANQQQNYHNHPLRPILVTTIGRPDSTLLMSVLASHPNVVVADERPFEVELLTFYAYGLRHLIAPGDHDRSLRPDQITAADNRFFLGFNPYHDASYRLRFKDPLIFQKFVASTLPARLGAAFRDVIVDFYNAVALDREKSFPLYFAEKALPEDLIRKSARFMFGAVKEIILVRDLRDALTAFIKYGNLDFEIAFASVSASMEHIMAVRRTSAHDACFVKYEDLVAEPKSVFHQIFEFLGLNPNIRLADQSELFNGHAASDEARSSIGRWRRDLDSEALRRCEQFADFHKLFGYEVLAPTAGPLILRPAAGPTATAEMDDVVSLRDRMLRFESLGENCEFGLVQRRCGAEPLSLLRFASAPLPKLLNALDARFEGMGTPYNIEVQLSDNETEYMVLDKCFGFYYHAWVKAGEQTPEQIHAREIRRLPFLVRKLIDDLTTASKIFVYHGMKPMSAADARALATAVRRYGPGKVLWVELSDAEHPPGSAEWVGPGLLCGRVDRFAPGENAHDLSLESWLDVCRSALAISSDETSMAPPQMGYSGEERRLDR